MVKLVVRISLICAAFGCIFLAGLLLGYFNFTKPAQTLRLGTRLPRHENLAKPTIENRDTVSEVQGRLQVTSRRGAISRASEGSRSKLLDGYLSEGEISNDEKFQLLLGFGTEKQIADTLPLVASKVDWNVRPVGEMELRQWLSSASVLQTIPGFNKAVQAGIEENLASNVRATADELGRMDMANLLGLYEADTLFRAGKYLEAFSRAEKLLALAPNDDEFYLIPLLCVAGGQKADEWFSG